MVRNSLVDTAMAWNPNYLLWIDSDQSFPNDALIRLLSLNLPIVGANYVQRAPPHLPTAKNLAGDLIWTTQDTANAEKVEEVSYLGLGFCLMDANIVRDIIFEQRKARQPIFALQMDGDGSIAKGEDVFFFNLARNLGHRVHVDHLLSWHIGHVSEKILMNSASSPPRVAL
jgi:hypothetical protein